MELRLAGIEKESLVDGPGIRTVVFVQGCSLACLSCHNPGAKEFNKGKRLKIKEVFDIINENIHIDGVTFSGGEPFEQAKALALLAEEFKKERELNLTTYTGYYFEDLLDKASLDEGVHSLLTVTDILVDGPYQEEKKNLQLPYRGSENQRFLDCKKSIKNKKAVDYF